jgi:hypothetical protein
MPITIVLPYGRFRILSTLSVPSAFSSFITVVQSPSLQLLPGIYSQSLAVLISPFHLTGKSPALKDPNHLPFPAICILEAVFPETTLKQGRYELHKS